jgi:hypothetical protein
MKDVLFWLLVVDGARRAVHALLIFLELDQKTLAELVGRKKK